jgi:predicted MFS family arabinose efflux permease
MTNGLGSLVGGIGVGFLADRLGFSGVFNSLAVFCVLIVIGALLCVESPARRVAAAESNEKSQQTTIGFLLAFLLVSQLLLAVTNATGSLGRSLAMNLGGFSKSAITMTASIGGLVALCLPLFLGWLSDKIGRKWVLIAAHIITSASLILLAFSGTAWHFYVFAGLFAMLSIPFSVGPAYVMDIVPREKAARGVSLFQSMFWTGNILGMAAGGVAFEKLGISMPILVSSLLPLAGVVLLLLIWDRNRTSVRP